MRSAELFSVRRGVRASEALFRASFAAILGLAAVALAGSPASAINLGPTAPLQHQLKEGSPVINVVVVRRGYVARGPRGGVVAGRTTVVRPGWNGGGVRWARPGWYRWPAGGAIAAGAALGFVAAGAAVAYGTPPVPGYCWYYTDPSRTQGFWDACP